MIHILNYINKMNNNELDLLNDSFNNISLQSTKNKFDINYVDLSLYSIDELSESIIKYNLFYNINNQNIILLTKDIINDINMIPYNSIQLDVLYNKILSNCSILKTNDNVLILYYPLKNNIDNSLNYNHLYIYQVGEVLYNLRINNFNEFMINKSNDILLNQINKFIKNNYSNIISTSKFLNTIIHISEINHLVYPQLNTNIPYGFILWLYFLMKIRQDYLNYYKVINFDEKIIECETIINIFNKLYYCFDKINKEVIKWFL